MNTLNPQTANLPQPSVHEDEDLYRLHRRFDRMGRLVGDDGMKSLFDSHVMVIGLGGVGSWAAESLARSGVGHLTLVDFDEICITNFNRQLHALGGLVGERKASVMAERLKKINPSCEAIAQVEFYNAASAERLFETVSTQPITHVIDAIDSVTSKCHLIDQCKKRGIKLISCMGTGGRMDPSQIRVGDLGTTTVDPLARSVRAILRQQYGFPDKGKYDILAVYSVESPTPPRELHYDGGKGFKCVCPQGQNEFFNCDNRNLIWGNASFVTGAAGLQAASLVVRDITQSGESANPNRT